jgi:hypothetical protein
VMNWAGLSATGPVLYESSTFSTPSDYQHGVDIVIPTDVAVTPGSKYIAFVSARLLAPLPEEDVRECAMGLVNTGTDLYSGGDFMSLFAAGDAEAWTNSNWTRWVNGDLAFRAEFSPVPEPCSLASLAVCCLAVIRKQKRQKG